MGEIQFAGIIATGALALTLVLQVPRRAAHHPIYGWARWLMFSGLALLTLQFFVQYLGNFRDVGVTQAVFFNLLFFMPSTLLISLSLLYVQRQSQISYNEWMTGWRCCFLAAAILIATALFDGVPFREESKALRLAEYVCAVIYVSFQSYYFVLHYREYRNMRQAVLEYFDRDRRDLLLWMGLSVVALALTGLFIPIFIFTQGWPLIIFSVFAYSTVYYCANSFHSYGISLDAQRVEEARRSQKADEEAEPTATDNFVLSEADKQRISAAAKRWADEGGYLKSNMTLTTVATEMDVQRYMLKEWLHESGYGKLSTWLNSLRTEEAKRLMAEHPDWSLDIVSEHCGFSSRQYFHKVFLQQTGNTPTSFQPRE